MQSCTWNVNCTCDPCVMWVCRFWKYPYVLLRVCTVWKYPSVLQCKVRILVFSHSLGSSARNKTYQSMRRDCRFLNMTLSSGFVKISARWSFVSIVKIEIVLSATCFQKWWYLIAICFVLRVGFYSLPLWCNCCYLQILSSGILVWYCEEEKLRSLRLSNLWMVLLLSLLEIELCTRILLCSMLSPFVACHTMSGDIRNTLSESLFLTGRILGWYDYQMTSLLKSPRQCSIPILLSYLVFNILLYLVRIASILRYILPLFHDITLDFHWSKSIGGLPMICLVVFYFAIILEYQ